METTHSETHGATGAAGSYDLDAMGLGPPTKVRRRGKIDASGTDAMHFAWAGDERPRQPHYYRLQAPSFLVEYDNTQDDANHVHTVWRDPDGDFGRDLLRAHLAEYHR